MSDEATTMTSDQLARALQKAAQRVFREESQKAAEVVLPVDKGAVDGSR